MNFSKNIKKIRNVKGLNQEAFGKLFDLSRATVGAYEEGRALPKIETLLQIANYISVSVDDLLKGNLTVNQIHGFAKVEKWTHQNVENAVSAPYYTSLQSLRKQKPEHTIQIPGFINIDSFAVSGNVLNLKKNDIYLFDALTFSSLTPEDTCFAITAQGIHLSNNVETQKEQIIYPDKTVLQKKEILNFGKQIGVISRTSLPETSKSKTLAQRVSDLEKQVSQLAKKQNK